MKARVPLQEPQQRDFGRGDLVAARWMHANGQAERCNLVERDELNMTA